MKKETPAKAERNPLMILLFFAWISFNLALLWLHEPWRDEANVFLMAKELTPVSLIREIRYQGHPCLWYLLVMPLAKANLPFVSISVLSFLITGAAAYLFVFRAPLNPVLKACFLASPVFTYYYPVVARNYCLIALLLMLLAYLYPKRNEKGFLYGLLLALLVQADTIAIPLAGMIFLWWILPSAKGGSSSKKGRLGLLLFPASLAFWGVQFLHVSDSPEFHVNRPSLSELPQRVLSVSEGIVARLTPFSGKIPLIILILLLAAAIFTAVWTKKIFPLLTLLSAILFEALFSIFIYELHIWHYLMLGYALLWFLWVSADETDPSSVPFLIPQLVLSAFAVCMLIRSCLPSETLGLRNALTGLYSDSKNAADYIRENIPSDALIVETNVSESSPVLALLGKDYVFYYAGTFTPETYADYGLPQSSETSYEALCEKIRNQFENIGNFYIMECKTSCLSNLPEDAEVLYESPEMTARGEEYRILKVTPGK